MNIWIRNTENRPDAVLTMTLLGFLIVIVKVLLAGMSVVVNGNTYGFGTIDAAVIAAVLTPTLGSYVARRYTDRKYADQPVEDPTDDEDDASGR